MNDLISVVLPVYNGGKYLSLSIESMINQSYKNIEIIILNDGSTDSSINTIDKYANIDSRIRVVSRENKGLIFTLNEGVSLSKGKFIARMDQDDISLENRLEVQYNYMKDNNLDICGGDYIEIDEIGNDIAKRKVFQKDDEILLVLASNVPFAHPSVMMKKEFLDNKGLKYGIDGKREAEDLDLWMNMYNYGAKFGNVDETILKYRILSTSMSRVNHKRIMKEIDGQFNTFVCDNINKYKYVFENIDKDALNTNKLSMVCLKALLRYTSVKFDIKIIFNVLIKIKTTDMIIGVIKYIKLKCFKR